jgi:hypothetical protein
LGCGLLMAMAMAALSAGCSASSDYMRPTTALPNAAPRPGMASVVFLRPSGFGGLVVMTIIDDKGRFIGDSSASSCFATQMPLG